ncbi:MAG TPA: aldo/keto reductase [Candidatus Dormibacteraeota bacterium]|nr:aldo/keto reductase [Candidatus Dormibacteraeota bacterium]
MRYVAVGGARVSVIGLGTWQFGSREWGYGSDYARSESGAIVREALKLGINLFDTAEIYGPWRSERILGEALRDHRDEALIATKLFPIGLPFMTGRRARGSARRLGVDHLDLYQLHWPSPLFPPRLTMPRFRRLVDDGLVGHAGVSNHSLAQWQAADDAFDGPVLSNQVRFSLLHREPERELVPWAEKNDRMVIAYSPLGQGLLSGRYQAAPPRNFRRVRADFVNLERWEPVISALREISSRRQATMSQVALAWLISKPNVVVIPGASSVSQLRENAGAAEVQLDSQDMVQLDSLTA